MKIIMAVLVSGLFLIAMFSGCVVQLSNPNMGCIDVYVSDQHGNPVSGATVKYSGKTLQTQGLTYDKGMRNFCEEYLKEFRLDVSKQGCESKTVHETYWSDNRFDVTINCYSESVNVKFNVKDQDGNSIEGASVYLVDQDRLAKEQGALQWTSDGIITEDWHVLLGLTNFKGEISSTVEKKSHIYYVKKTGYSDDTYAVPAYKDIEVESVLYSK